MARVQHLQCARHWIGLALQHLDSAQGLAPTDEAVEAAWVDANDLDAQLLELAGDTRRDLALDNVVLGIQHTLDELNPFKFLLWVELEARRIRSDALADSVGDDCTRLLWNLLRFCSGHGLDVLGSIEKHFEAAVAASHEEGGESEAPSS